MTLLELMTEEAKTQIKNLFYEPDFEDVCEDYGFTIETDDFDEYLDEFNCFRTDNFIFKTENGKITKAYYVYEIHATKAFGDNNELLLISGHENIAIINRNTLCEVVNMYTR